VASLGVQVHGGMGFVEETGAAQYYRDARILPIYEGTNGIQALDLVMRKLPMAGGEVMKGYLAEIQETVQGIRESNTPELTGIADQLERALGALGKASMWIGENLASDPDAVMAGATPYLKLFGLTAGGHYLGRGALRVCRSGDAELAGHIQLARFYATHHLTETSGLAVVVMGGSDLLSETSSQMFAV